MTGKVEVQLAVAPRIATKVGKVRFYVDDRRVSQDYRAPYSFTWNSRSAAPGSKHTIQGVAYDRWGRKISSASIQVTVASRVTNSRTVAAASESAFTDLSYDSSYAEPLTTLAETSVMSGFADGRIGAEQGATRAQFAKMLALSLGVADENLTQTPFGDLDPIDENLYPHKFVAALYSLEVLQGTKPTQFSPHAPITRAQVVTTVVRALQMLDPDALVTPASGSFSVLGDFSPHHARAMAIAQASGLLEDIQGFGASWNPWAPAPRGEVAQILFNLVSLH